MINAKEFLKALDELETQKHISKESIISALKEAMEKGLIKQLGITPVEGLAEAQVRVDIDSKKGTIEMYVLKNVVDEVKDDFLEISLEDASKDGKEYHVGDIYEIPVSTDELSKLTAQGIKSVLRQKISEAEKQAIYEKFQEKKGEMVTGKIEKVDDRSAIVNVEETSIYLPKSQMIPGETFRIGDKIRLYVVDVQNNTKGAQIIVSRTDPGFLKRLFEEEIHEIIEGIVVIKDIAREAGERSKVAVIGLDQNVDPIGACIGPNGTRVQKICSALGNTKEKEKIDVIAYTDNPGLYIVEALKPANVVGVLLYEDEKKAVAVVRNNELSLAIGKKGVNARLAVKLTGWNIDIKEQDEAMRLGIPYLTVDEMKRQAAMAKLRLEEEKLLGHNDELEEPLPEMDEVEEVEETVTEPVVEEVKAPVEEQEKVQEEVEEETPVTKVEPKKEEPKEETTVVHTKVKLADLEKELEDEKKRKERQAQYAARKKKTYRSDDATNEEEEKDTTTPTVDRSTYMPIYTDEELEELDNEEEDIEEEDDIDYDEFDSYYDDDDR